MTRCRKFHYQYRCSKDEGHRDQHCVLMDNGDAFSWTSPTQSATNADEVVAAATICVRKHREIFDSAPAGSDMAALRDAVDRFHRER